MAVISLAVKYRPKTFDDVTEQGSVKTILTQQLATQTTKNAYLFCGGAGTGKTTCARIFASAINNGQGTPIEMDAASNNSVEDVREIIAQAKTKSLNSEYKVFILDECVTGDTEILTSTGFKRFDALSGSELVAQYSDDGTIQFVKPSKFIKMEYTGNLKVWNPRNWCTIRMTPNHVQPLYYKQSKVIKECYAKDLKFNQNKNLIVSGRGSGNSEFTPIDRLAIVCQADGTLQHTTRKATHWLVMFKKPRKIERFLKLCADANIVPTEVKSTREGYKRYTFDMPLSVSKLLSTHFELDMSYDKARLFIDEVKNWDGYIGKHYLYYSSVVKENADFVSAVATLGGYSSRVRLCKDDRKETYSDIYRVYMYDTNYTSCQNIQKTYHDEYFDGYVYCVKVPSQKIVVRSGGFTFITGNCHALSNTAWQAMLKLLEEPPAKSIFIFATTDPQKIPKTILSRVQRYDFQRISKQGIINRLDYICRLEQKEGNWGVSWNDDAIDYIAKIADGGMRDAITLLDKCLAYSVNLTLENVVKAIGTVDYDIMFQLVDSILDRKTDQMLNIIGQVHIAGKDLKLFMKSFTNFVLDLCKYSVTESFTYLQIPGTYEAQLKTYTKGDFDYFNQLLSNLIKLNADIKWETSPRYSVEAMLMLECLGD